MIREQEPLAVLIAIVIGIVVLGGFAVFAVSKSLQTIQGEIAASNAGPVDVSGWQLYENDQYGFELEYPPGWQVSTAGLANQTPFVALGNPLDGTKTYAMDVFIETNTSTLSSGEYAHAIIDAARAADAQNSAAPQTAPQFSKAEVLTVGAYPAYELYSVFEFDHNAERIYVAHGDEALRFDFPVEQENPNISLPVANNAVAHEIMDTLTFTD